MHPLLKLTFLLYSILSEILLFFLKSSKKILQLKKVSNDFFEFEIPADGYKNVIFLRCNKNNATADWSRVWNQTEDLTLKHMCFCVDSWTQSDLTDARWF